MATHSGVLAWRIPWTEVLVDYRPKGQSQTQLKRLSTRTYIYFFHTVAQAKLYYSFRIISKALDIRIVVIFRKERCCSHWDGAGRGRLRIF